MPNNPPLPIPPGRLVNSPAGVVVELNSPVPVGVVVEPNNPPVFPKRLFVGGAVLTSG